MIQYQDFNSVDEEVHAAGDNEELQAGNFRLMDWKKDVNERARRIYNYWRMIMNENRGDDIPRFCEALRLVVLVQASSAFVERIFSQLTFIRRIVGDRIEQETLELRAFIRCNAGLTEEFNDV